MRYKFCIIAATLLCRATGGNCVMKAGAVSEIFLRRCLGYKWHKAQNFFFTATPRFFFFYQLRLCINLPMNLEYLDVWG